MGGLRYFGSMKIPKRLILRSKQTCQLCGRKALCARFPFDDDLPNDGLGPWCCRDCWRKEMGRRRAYNAHSPDRLLVLRWPKRNTKRLRATQEGDVTTVGILELIRAWSAKEPPRPRS